MTSAMHGRQHFVLMGILISFSFAVAEGSDALGGRLWWLIGCGLFLLWQPIVSAERRLSRLQAMLVLLVVTGLVLRLDWSWLAVSVILLASLLGGMVIVARDRRVGWYYLLAFGYLCVLLFFWISPRLYGNALVGSEAVWARWLTSGVLLATVLAMPWRVINDATKAFDFLISLLILLILVSVLMAVGFLVAVERASHLAAMVRALLGLGGAVLLLSWIWNPRLGFSGFGAMFSRYLLQFGFPFEEWLRRISLLFDQEGTPDEFLGRAIQSFGDLPWVSGGSLERSDGTAESMFGCQDRHRAILVCGDLRLVLYTSYAWTVSLVWQANLLFRLVVEYYRARQRDRLLRQLQYVQAVYETGSRVTHDVKNLLQSIEGMCFALDGEVRQDEGARTEVIELVRRQLPEISRRLRSTLEKLVAPAAEESLPVNATDWWNAVRQRYRGTGVSFGPMAVGLSASIPGALFDNVLDNLIANARQKQIQTPEMAISAGLEQVAGEVLMWVKDDGAPVDASVANSLFDAPVPSTAGLGVGLFHAARLAGRFGYRLELADNRAGSVEFRLCLPVSDQAGARASRG